MEKITLSVAELESLIAKAQDRCDSVYIPVVEVIVRKRMNYHGISDVIDAYLVSGYSDGDSEFIYSNK